MSQFKSAERPQRLENMYVESQFCKGRALTKGHSRN